MAAVFPGASDWAKFTEHVKKNGDVIRTWSKGATGAMDKFAGSTSKASKGMFQFIKGMAPASGLVGAVAKGLAKLGPEGQAAAAAILVLHAVIATTVGALFSMAEAAIDVVQQRAALLATFSALGGGAAQGAKTLAIVDQLGISLPFATEKVGEWAKSLQSAGFQGAALKSAIGAVAAATALMGESGGAAAEKMLKQLAEGGQAATKMLKQIQEGSPKSARLLADMGLRIEDVAKAAGMSVKQFKAAHLGAEAMAKAVEKALAKKGAGPLEAMATTFPVMLAKVKEGLLSTFEKLGPAVKPFMKAVKSLFGEFSKGSPLIKTLQKVVTVVFTVLFGWATRAVKAIHGIFTWLMASGKSSNFFGSAIKLLKGAWTGVVTVFSTVKAAMSPILDLLKKIFSNAMVLSGIKTIFTLIAGAITVVIVLVAAVLGGIAMIAGVVAGAVGALIGLGAAALGAASDFIDGIINGITGGTGGVVEAVSNLASSALAAFKSILGIASPSKVMAKMGGHFTAGAAQGIDAGAPKVEASASKVGGAAAGGASKGMGGGKGGGGKGASVTFEKGAIQIDGAGKSAMEITEEMLAVVFERIAAARGL